MRKDMGECDAFTHKREEKEMVFLEVEYFSLSVWRGY
jgi:Holliday junction resolvase-like predicted endonuclease